MDEEGGTGLPASIEAAWGLRERPHKGPKPGLSLERIVDAAVQVATAEGLPAVSMGRVATELSAATMSLYRYVAAKDELLALMVDAAMGSSLDDEIPDGDWRAGLSAWARSYRDLLRRCPWVVRVPISTPPITPNQIAAFEVGLRTLRDTGLPAEAKVSVILLVSGFVRSDASLTADLAEAFEASGGATEQLANSYGKLLLKLTDAEHFPALHEVIAGGAFDDDPEDWDEFGEFDFGLERVLDGIEALIRRRH